MTTTTPLIDRSPADRFGLAVARRLGAGIEELPYEQRERLRAARVRAVQARKMPAVAPVVVGRGAGATLALGGNERSLFNRIASVLPLLALVAGLVVLHDFQGDWRASELAEVDAALLTDDLPPSAYADPGFAQFLKQSGRSE
jgi:hypothetical protein